MAKKSQKKAIKANCISDCVGFSEEYSNKFSSYFLSKEAEKISQLLNDRTQSLKPNAGSYRQVNSWDQYGLIDVNRDGSEWRKYSIMDSVWLNLIAELRTFSVAIEKIKTTKETLEEGASKRSPMPSLEFCIYKALLEKNQTFLLVFSDGSAIPIPFEEYMLNIASGELKNHIRIDLNEILLRQFENNKNMKPVYEAFFIKQTRK